MSESGRPKRRVNPMLLLGEDDSASKKTAKPDETPEAPKASGVESVVRKPSTGAQQGQLVESTEFKKKRPTNGLLLPSVKAPKPDETPAPEDPGAEKSLPKPSVPKADAPKKAVPVSELIGEKPVKETPAEPEKPARRVVNPMFDLSSELDAPLPAKTKPATPKAKPVAEKPAPEEKVADTKPEEKKPARRVVNPMFDLSSEVDVPLPTPTKTLRINPIVNPGGSSEVDTPKLPKRDTSSLFKEKPDAKPRSRYSKKIEPQIEADDWTDDTSTDTPYGLGGENDSAAPKPQYDKGFHMTDRDITIIRFLARYRYAYTDQLARLVDTMPRTIISRLRTLEKRGFIRKQPITDRQYLWVSRKAGNVLADINFPEIKKGTLSYITLPHTIGLVNLGVEFEREAGGKDLLGEGKGIDNWEVPSERWKFGIWGHPDGQHKGYMTVTEREIRQAQLRNRGGRDTKEMRELTHLAFSNPDPIELEEGQEHLFVVYGSGGKTSEHVPDLVVTRPRDENGKSQHIAIELELTPKSPAEWKKILRTYRDEGIAFQRVVYFTHKRSISTGILKADEEVGLGDRLVIRKYIPQNGNLPFWG
jgi:hypothetical protein